MTNISHETFDQQEARFLKGEKPIVPNPVPATFTVPEAIPQGTFYGVPPLEKHYEHSSVRRAKYMAEEKILEIEFASGAVYHYQGILPITWEALHKCEAPGKFVHSDLKDYKYEKINQNAK